MRWVGEVGGGGDAGDAVLQDLVELAGGWVDSGVGVGDGRTAGLGYYEGMMGVP